MKKDLTRSHLSIIHKDKLSFLLYPEEVYNFLYISVKGKIDKIELLLHLSHKGATEEEYNAYVAGNPRAFATKRSI
jgi:hypothetical protein